MPNHTSGRITSIDVVRPEARSFVMSCFTHVHSGSRHFVGQQSQLVWYTSPHAVHAATSSSRCVNNVAIQLLVNVSAANVVCYNCLLLWKHHASKNNYYTGVYTGILDLGQDQAEN